MKRILNISEYLDLNNNDIMIGGYDDQKNKYKIIKEIGIGMMGTVYLIEDQQNNKYAMKIEKNLEEQINKSLKYDLWREIEFQKTMNKKYPNQNKK